MHMTGPGASTPPRPGMFATVRNRRGTIGPESGDRFTVKRHGSAKEGDGEGGWRHVRITLKPENRDFPPIELTVDDEGSVEVVAEFLEVVG